MKGGNLLITSTSTKAVKFQRFNFLFKKNTQEGAHPHTLKTVLTHDYKICLSIYLRTHYCTAIDKTTDQLLHVETSEEGGKFGLLGVRIHRLEYPRGFPLGLSWRWIQIPFAHWTTYSGQFRAKPGIPPLPAPAASQALHHHLCLPRLSRTGKKKKKVS